LVSLAVCGQTLLAKQQQARLGDSALWYPELPGPRLNMHDKLFLPIDRYIAGYNPLFWTHFGGKGGMFLQHLVRIRTSRLDGTICQLQFFFDKEVPPTCCTLGLLSDGYARQDDDFYIDGPGGERIETVEVGYSCPYYWDKNGSKTAKEAVLVSCKVCLMISNSTLRVTRLTN
jgi:hypothetical protein